MAYLQIKDILLIVRKVVKLLRLPKYFCSIEADRSYKERGNKLEGYSLR